MESIRIHLWVSPTYVSKLYAREIQTTENKSLYKQLWKLNWSIYLRQNRNKISNKSQWKYLWNYIFSKLFNSFCKLHTCLLIHTISSKTLRKSHANNQTEFSYFNDGNPLRLVDIYSFFFFACLIKCGNCRVRFIWRLIDSTLKMLKQKVTEKWRVQDNVKQIKYKRLKFIKLSYVSGTKHEEFDEN